MARLSSISDSDNVPEAPDWAAAYDDVLDVAAAQDAWGSVIRELQNQETLSLANGPMIERLVRFRIEFDRANRDVSQRGAIIKARRTSVLMVNPYFTIMRQANDHITRLEVKLGLPPGRRAKIDKLSRNNCRQKPVDHYLRPSR